MGVRVDESSSGNAGNDFGTIKPVAALEDAANDAFLTPDLARGEFSICMEAGEFCAGARAAWRTVVGSARAEDEVPAMDAGSGRIGEEFDVVDFLAIVTGDSLLDEGLANGEGEIR